jgi:hypothetical protein
MFATDSEKTKKYFAYEKAKNVREFKKIYGGGVLGYSDIYSFGNSTQFTGLAGSEYLDYTLNLENKLKEYLNEIPESVVYSVIPVLRWQYTTGEYKSLSISNSIKITRDTNRNLLAKRIIFDITNTLFLYDLQGLDIELLIMGRP